MGRIHAGAGRLTARPPPQTESQHGRWLFDWALKSRHRHPGSDGLVHVPNGGKRTGVVGLLMAEGVRKGYPDYLLDAARGRYHGLRIELKRLDRWRIEPEQRAWIDTLRREGYCAHVCIGWRSAAHLIATYLALPSGGAITETDDRIYWGGEL